MESKEVLEGGGRLRTESEESRGMEKDDMVDTGACEEKGNEEEKKESDEKHAEEGTEKTNEESCEVTEPVEGKKEESGVEGKVEEEKEELNVDLEAEYELTMVVCHVRESWMESLGNLVAHIKVGPSYHLRKEVS